MPPDDKALVQHAIARQPQVSACSQQALRQVCIQTENVNDIYKCIAPLPSWSCLTLWLLTWTEKEVKNNHVIKRIHTTKEGLIQITKGGSNNRDTANIYNELLNARKGNYCVSMNTMVKGRTWRTLDTNPGCVCVCVCVCVVFIFLFLVDNYESSFTSW